MVTCEVLVLAAMVAGSGACLRLPRADGGAREHWRSELCKHMLR